jgi:hypothetical protein
MAGIREVIDIMQKRYDMYPCSQDEFNDGYWQGYLDAITGLRKVYEYPKMEE